MHPTSRISKVTLLFQNITFNLFCIYAHSGKNYSKEREELFENELLSLVQCNPGKTVMGGDWNCIISEKDSSNPKNSCFSKNLKNIVNELKFKDIHNLVTKIPEYTYIKSNYACRLDCIYAIDFVKGISS